MKSRELFRNPIATIDDRDFYALLLFVLFKLKDDEKYSSLSQLMFVLNKSSVLSLFEYFGGMTITIPTIEDLELILYCLLVYKKVKIDGEDLDSTIHTINQFTISEIDNYESHKFTFNEIKKAYDKIEKVMEDYDFNVTVDK